RSKVPTFEISRSIKYFFMLSSSLAIQHAYDALLIPAWVIVWIDVVELKRRLPMDLHDSFSTRHCEVVHVRIEKGKAPGGERFHLVSVKFIAHADFERPGNDGDVFPLRVPMRSDAEPIRHLQSNGEIAGGSGW